MYMEVFCIAWVDNKIWMNTEHLCISIWLNLDEQGVFWYKKIFLWRGVNKIRMNMVVFSNTKDLHVHPNFGNSSP